MLMGKFMACNNKKKQSTAPTSFGSDPRIKYSKGIMIEKTDTNTISSVCRWIKCQELKFYSSIDLWDMLIFDSPFTPLSIT